MADVDLDDITPHYARGQSEEIAVEEPPAPDVFEAAEVSIMTESAHASSRQQDDDEFADISISPLPSTTSTSSQDIASAADSPPVTSPVLSPPSTSTSDASSTESMGSTTSYPLGVLKRNPADEQTQRKSRKKSVRFSFPAEPTIYRYPVTDDPGPGTIERLITTNQQPGANDSSARGSSAAGTATFAAVVGASMASDGASGEVVQADGNGTVMIQGDEWDVVNAQRMAERNAAPGPAEDIAVTPISYTDALNYLLSVDRSNVEDTVVVFDPSLAPPKRGVMYWLTCGAYHPRPTPLRGEGLILERLFVLCCARMQFNDYDAAHVRMLRTLYARLTGSTSRQCARFGSHWETIGFQGNDPATDLRGCGLFGLLQLLFFAAEPAYSALAIDVVTLSRTNLSSQGDFPFAVAGINLSKSVLEVLRSGAANEIANRWESVILVANQLYVAMFYELYLLWKPGTMRIQDFSRVVKLIRDAAIKDPEALLDQLLRGMAERKARATGADTSKRKGSNDNEFTNMT
jgi:hypothetical protein